MESYLRIFTNFSSVITQTKNSPHGDMKSVRKNHKMWLPLCFLLIFDSVLAEDLSIGLRSKGDPPMILQHRVQQRLNSNYQDSETDFSPSLIHYENQDNEPWKPSPYRESPYKEEEEVNEETQAFDDTGISVTLDERTFDALGNTVNMGKFVSTTAKGLRGMVDGAAKFVHNSIQKTLRPKRKPPVIKEGSLFDILGFSTTKKPDSAESSYGAPPNVISTTSGYGVPQAPPITTPSPVLPPSPSYGVPEAPVIGNEDYGPPPVVLPSSVNSNYGTNFQDVRNSVGPSIQSLQNSYITTTPTPNQFQSTTANNNPFMSSADSLPSLPTTTTSAPILDTIYRPKRNKIKKRPGKPPFFHSTTPPRIIPSLVTTIASLTPTTAANINQKDKDLEDVKLAWYNYYKKASKYARKYREAVDVNKFRRSLEASKRPNKQVMRTTPLPRLTPTTAGPHPQPFSGKVHMQLPFRQKKVISTQVPFFTLLPRNRPRPRPPSPQPMRRKPPSLNFNRREEQMKKMEDSHDFSYLYYDNDDDSLVIDYNDFYPDEAAFIDP